jgi:hypothetical protein
MVVRGKLFRSSRSWRDVGIRCGRLSHPQPSDGLARRRSPP